MVCTPESEADTPSRRTRSLSILELSSVFAQVALGCPDRCWNLAHCPRQIAGVEPSPMSIIDMGDGSTKKSWTACAVSLLTTPRLCPIVGLRGSR